MRRLLILLFTLGLLLTGCGDDGGDDDESTQAPDGDLPEMVVVFTPDDTATDAHGTETTWTPEADAVLAAEAALAEHIGADPGLGVEPLDGYARQYVGVGQNEDLVSVNALCAAAIDDLNWEDDLIGVADGGSCFWQATVNPATGTVESFTVNGSA